MAYVVNLGYTGSIVTTANMSLTVPKGARIGDLLLFFIAQDGASTTAITAAGLTNSAAQVRPNGIRVAVMHTVVTEATLDKFEFAGAAEEWQILCIAIRDVDVTTPIGNISIATTASSGISFNAPTVNSVREDSLILHAMMLDGKARLLPADTTSGAPVMGLHNMSNDFVALAVSCKDQSNIGATGTYAFLSDMASEGGAGITIALNNLLPYSGRRNISASTNSKFVHHIGAVISGTSTRSFSRHDTSPNVVAGIPDPAKMPTYAGLTIVNNEVLVDGIDLEFNTWASCTAVDARQSATVETYSSVYIDFPSTDLQGKALSMEIGAGETSTRGGRIGSMGVALVFQDSAGNLSGHSVIRSGDIPAETVNRVYFTPSLQTPVDSYGTIDWTQIVRCYIMCHLGIGAFLITTYYRELQIVGTTTITGGCDDRPVTAYAATMHNEAKTFRGTFVTNGKAQYRTLGALQLGNGVDKTKLGMNLSSLEQPDSVRGSFESTYWGMAGKNASVTIHASPLDIIDIRSSVFSTSGGQDFVFHTDSSPAAEYLTEGVTISGFKVHLNASITIEEVNLVSCIEVWHSAGVFTKGSITDSVGAVAFTTNNPSNITNTDFNNPLSHDIEITAAGTYTLSGITFESSGADGSLTANILNSSGGAVTLNVVNGSTPTVKNTAGSTTTVVSSVNITITGLKAGTEVRVYDSLSNEVAGIETVSGSSFSFSSTPATILNIVIFHVEYDPLYIDSYEVGTVNTTIPVVQNVTRSYQP